MEKMVLKEKIKYFLSAHVLELLFSITCVAILLALFLSWKNDQKQLSGTSLNAAVLSAALFATLGVIFVFKWFNEFRNSEKFSVDAKAFEDNKGFGDRANMLIVYLSLLAVSFCVLLLVWVLQCVFVRNMGFGDSLNIWRQLDSQHYIHIADHWYAFGGFSEETLGNDVRIAFFPGYPVLIKTVKLLTFGLVDTFTCSMFISINMFAGAGCMLYRLMRLDYSKDEALRSVLFFCLIPGAFFFIAPMSESLFLFVTLASIYFSRRGNYFLGSLFGFYAAFTRSLGIIVLVPVIYELILRTIKEKPSGRSAVIRRLSDFALPLLIIPCGLLAYLLLNYKVTGDAFTFLDAQKNHWGQEISYFFNTASYQVKYFADYIEGGRSSVAFALWGMGSCALFGTLAVLILGARKMRASYLGYSMVYFVISMGATWLLSAPRYAAGLFSLPVALALITKNRVIQGILTILCVVIYIIYATMFVMRWQVW